MWKARGSGAPLGRTSEGGCLEAARVNVGEWEDGGFSRVPPLLCMVPGARCESWFPKGRPRIHPHGGSTTLFWSWGEKMALETNKNVAMGPRHLSVHPTCSVEQQRGKMDFLSLFVAEFSICTCGVFPP